MRGFGGIGGMLRYTVDFQVCIKNISSRILNLMNCFSRCNATTWMMLTTTWTTIKLSKSSLQLKLFHHNLHLGSTYTLVLDMTKLLDLAALCLGLV